MRSISFDAPHGADQKRIAFVRLVPPPLSWRSNGADQEVSRPSQEPASHLHETSEDRAAAHSSLCSHETSKWLQHRFAREHGNRTQAWYGFQALGCDSKI